MPGWQDWLYGIAKRGAEEASTGLSVPSWGVPGTTPESRSTGAPAYPYAIGPAPEVYGAEGPMQYGSETDALAALRSSLGGEAWRSNDQLDALGMPRYGPESDLTVVPEYQPRMTADDEMILAGDGAQGGAWETAPVSSEQIPFGQEFMPPEALGEGVASTDSGSGALYTLFQTMMSMGAGLMSRQNGEPGSAAVGRGLQMGQEAMLRSERQNRAGRMRAFYRQKAQAEGLSDEQRAIYEALSNLDMNQLGPVLSAAVASQNTANPYEKMVFGEQLIRDRQNAARQARQSESGVMSKNIGAAASLAVNGVPAGIDALEQSNAISAEEAKSLRSGNPSPELRARLRTLTDEANRQNLGPQMVNQSLIGAFSGAGGIPDYTE